MVVFLCWSGPNSKRVAECLKEWLKTIIQTLDPWISSEDIRKGAMWSPEIAEKLKNSGAGITCVTPDNQDDTWLNFESGAISIAAGKPNVCTYLVGLKVADLQGPLSQFQATLASRPETLQLLKDLNALLEKEKNAISEKVLEKTFDKFWPDLEGELADIASSMVGTAPDKPKRPQGEMIEETLEIVRELRNQKDNKEPIRTVYYSVPNTERNLPYTSILADSTPGSNVMYSTALPNDRLFYRIFDPDKKGQPSAEEQANQKRKLRRESALLELRKKKGEAKSGDK